ncbi:aspartyl protease family protein 1-like isoform X1 [Camellia sinensis]|uniref:aspartyl protease family protein 1-like isoform X1 n=1 Tax=Camellia sinensis TaxID=4442 RepID=UPI001035F684|nr:aspartyl protease family protein 1-like isoform X1 [Camellia sinensis]
MGYYYYYYYVVLMMMVVWGSQSCDGFGTFGFNIHHRYSDPVKGILDLRGLPEKGSIDYYAAMAHRDLLFHGRKLAAVTSAPLTFVGGNDTYQLNALGHLFYANVSVGSPSLRFLVALDTGSDLFWLPCDCIQCVRGLQTTSGQVDFNIYSPSNSTTSSKVSCNSTFCGQCSLNTCPYYDEYLSNNTSSFGLLVEDVLHLTTDDSQLKAVDAQITFGCGIVQTGLFLDGGAPNGLFGLGMKNISVPSILANQGLAANSFSMCFGPDGIGRISFGDKGSSEQGETPFNLGQSHPTYNISITQITVDKNVTDLSFTAIFDSGTSFTYLNDPAYSVITEGFNSQAKEKRHPPDSQIPFEYCYDLSANQTTFETASLNLTMKGGKQFPVTNPIEIIDMQGQGYIYCLAVVKSGDINIIGQNFMTGYRIIFDRERMVLGWESSNCYNATNSSTLPINPGNSGAVTPTTTVEPQATSSSTNGSPLPSPDVPPPASSDSPHLNSYTYTLHAVVILSLFIHGFVILSS